MSNNRTDKDSNQADSVNQSEINFRLNNILPYRRIAGKKWSFIERGVRFAVYSNGSEVLKIPLSPDQLAQFTCTPDQSSPSHECLESIYGESMRRSREIRRRIMLGAFPFALFANPIVESNGWVFQRLLSPVSHMLHSNSDESIRKLIDLFIDCIEECICWGVLGPYFAFPVDCALDRTGRLVMMGFGQLDYDRELAFEYVSQKPWRNEISGRHMLPPTVQDYFVSRLDERITHGLLLSTWGEKSHHALSLVPHRL